MSTLLAGLVFGLVPVPFIPQEGRADIDHLVVPSPGLHKQHLEAPFPSAIVYIPVARSLVHVHPNEPETVSVAA